MFLLIEGLFAAGEEPLPLLRRLAARGESGRLLVAPAEGPLEAGAALAALFGKAAASAFHAALGAGLSPDPALTWCRLDFTHLRRQRDKLLFLSAEQVGRARAEARQLAESLHDEFAHHGFALHVGQHDHLFLSTTAPFAAATLPFSLLVGASFMDHLPAGPQGRDLQHLLNGCQMAVSRHPVNLKRKAEGRLALNTPWIWGIGGGGEAPGGTWQGTMVSADPLPLGLAREAGMAVRLLPQEGDDPGVWRDMLMEEEGVLHLEGAALLARHGLHDERLRWLARLQEECLEPLLAHLGTVGGALLIGAPCLVDEAGRGVAGEVPWIHGSGKALTAPRRFWHRRQVGEGVVLSGEQLHKRWFS